MKSEKEAAGGIIKALAEFEGAEDIDGAAAAGGRVLAESVNLATTYCHLASANAGWWDGVDMADRNVVPAKLCLIHSEISEAMEGDRKGLADEKLPHRPMCEVELADALIRICDLAGKLGYDLGGAVAEKLEYNARRADHKREARAGEGGKAY